MGWEYCIKILLCLILFLLGWFSSGIYTSYFENDDGNVNNNVKGGNIKNFEYNANQQFAENLDIQLMKFEELERLENMQESKDKPSQKNRINKEHIFVYDDEVVIKVKNPEWAIFTNTKSMDPVIDSTSKAIQIVPKNEEDIHVGDIVAYKSKYNDGIVTHRVIGIGYDDFGWYSILKGDNNNDADPEKVRFEQIKRVVVAIIY